MKIRNISIRNYRGIKELDWKVTEDFICFIGAGDSTKTTILDAIEVVLNPRWNCVIEDTDFFNLDVSQTLSVTVTLGQLPESFLSEQKYGLFLRGWSAQAGLHDEPKEGDEKVLTISLRVGKDLEPKWLVINDRLPEEKRISATDRALIGSSRLGSYANRHLSWASGSALSAMTGEDVKLNEIMAEAVRKVRAGTDVHSLEEITTVVEKAKRLGEALGVVSKGELKARLDIKKLSIKESGVSLHDGNVPLRLSGAGTQRLMGLALQIGLQEKGGIVLIDEIEHGLEPHRICQVLSLLKTKTSSCGQVFLTTHSSCVLQDLNINNLKIVFSENGVTRIEDIVDDADHIYQRWMRSNPFAFLSKRIIVCEGKTEIGVLRAIDKWWQGKGKRGFWSYGVVAVHGGGDRSFSLAEHLHKLKYRVLWWGDSDVAKKAADKKKLSELGVAVVEWENTFCVETRVFSDLPWDSICNLIRTAVDQYGEQSVFDQVKRHKDNVQLPCGQWIDSPELRQALGNTAKAGEWYKNEYQGEILGQVISGALLNITGTDLYKRISTIWEWIAPDEYR